MLKRSADTNNKKRMINILKMTVKKIRSKFIVCALVEIRLLFSVKKKLIIGGQV